MYELGFLYGLWFVSYGIHWSVIKFVEFSGIIISGILIQGGFFLLCATLSFWIIQASNFVNLGWTLNANYMTYPLSVYDKGTRFLFTFYPLAFITYYPAASFLGKSSAWGYAICTYSPIVAIFFLAMYGFWRFGTRFYQSAG